MKNLARLALGIFVCACLAAFCFAGRSEARENASEGITVAMANNSPPFYFLNESGEPSGWLIELWRLWSEQTGVKIKFLPATFPESLEMIKNGKADAHAGLFFSKARTAFVDYAFPLAKADTSIFYHRNLYGIRSAADLRGLMIGVVKGDYAEGYLKRTNLDLNIIAFKDKEAMFTAAREGEIKALVADTPVGVYFLKRYKLNRSFKYHPGQPLYSSEFFAAVKKGDPSLTSLVKTGFTKISEHERTTIARKWSGGALKDAEDVITVAADRNFPPFTWLTDSGRPAGILVDLWRLWSSKTGKRIEFVFGDWSETMAFLKDGRAMIHSGLFKEQKRSKYLNYSLPLVPVEVDLFYRKNDGEPDLNNMRGKRIGMLFGTGYEAILDHKIPQARFVGFENYNDMLPALAQGRIDGVVDVGISITFAMRSLGLSGLIARYPEPMAVKNLYAGVAKGDPDTLALVGRGLGEIPKEVMIELEEHWVPDPGMRLYKKLASELNLTPEEKAWLAGHKNIRLGIDQAYLPFDGLDSHGRYIGMGSDYVALLNKKLGIDMRVADESNWHQVLQSARTGEVDVIPCIARTEDRGKYLLFTRPYATYPNVVVTRKDHPLLSGLKGLAGAKVAVVRDFAIHEYIRKNHPGITIVPVEGIEEGLQVVEKGNAAAYVDILPTINYYMKKSGTKDLTVSATTKIMCRLSFGVRKDWPQLQTILEKALQSISEEEHEKIASRWVNLQVSRETDWQTVITAIAATAVAVGIILAVIIIWNRRMAREVAERKAAEERFSTMAANVPGAIFQVEIRPDGKRKWLYLSSRAEQFFGIPVERIVAENRRFTYHPDDEKRMLREVEQSFEDRKEHNLVGRIVLPGGEVKWIRIKASPTPAAQGVLHYNGFILDITQRKLAEQEYLATERKIKAMSQAVEDALVMIDSKGKVLFWNPAAERLFGYSENEAMGMDFHDMAAPAEFHNKIRPGLERFARTGEGKVLGVTTEITAHNRKGEQFPAEVTLSSFNLDDEWYAVGTVRDISERKKAEEEIRKSREDFRIIADYTFDWEGWHDSEGQLLWVNPAVERITGFSVEECMQMPGYPLPMIHPDDADVWRDSLETARKGRPGNDVPLRIIHKNGQAFWIALSWNPVFDREGDFTGFRISARDFTERKEAEDALKESEKYMKKILETTRDGFWFIDNDGYTLDVNRAMCEILDRPRDEVVGRHATEFYDEVNLRILKDQMALREALEETTYEIALSRPDGSQVICLFNATPFLDDTGQKTGSFAMVSDITEKKRAEDRLRFTQYTVDKAAMSIFWINPETGCFSYVNDAGCQSLGYSRDELLEMTVPQIDLDFHPEAFGELLGILGTRQVVQTQGRHRTRQGEVLEVQLSISMIKQGDKDVIIVYSKDITEQKKAETALIESEERSRLILSSAGEGIFGVDTRGRISFINPKALDMLGFTENEILGKKVHDLIHHTREDGSGYPIEECPMYEAYTTGETHHVDDEVLWRKDGGHFPVEYSSTPIVKDDRLMGAVITFKDITERLEAEQELKRNLEELERFNRLVVGRELKMIALKEEINGLLNESGRGDKYKIVE